MDLAELESELRTTRSRLDTETGQARALAERGKRLQEEVAAAQQAREVADRVSGVLSQIGSDRDAAAREQVESLVSAGLAAIFGSEGGQLSFHLIESMSRQTPQIDFVVRTTLPDGTSYDTDVLSARGGGMAAVVGLLLRVVLILLTRQTHPERASDVLVLDETLAHLSDDYLEPAAQFLRTLVDQTGLQIIMVTHQSELAEPADVVYRLSLDAQGVSQARRVQG